MKTLETVTTENTDNMVLVDKDYLNQLEEDQRWLLCLEAAGVDNWSGYDYAREMYHDYNEDD